MTEKEKYMQKPPVFETGGRISMNLYVDYIYLKILPKPMLGEALLLICFVGEMVTPKRG